MTEPLIVIPCLKEEAHIGPLVSQLGPALEALDARLERRGLFRPVGAGRAAGQVDAAGFGAERIVGIEHDIGSDVVGEGDLRQYHRLVDGNGDRDIAVGALEFDAPDAETGADPESAHPVVGGAEKGILLLERVAVVEVGNEDRSAGIGAEVQVGAVGDAAVGDR